MSQFVTANGNLTQQINKSIVLRTIRDHQPVYRAQIAQLTGLTKTTVSSIVEALMRDGLITEVGQGEAFPRGGARPTLLSLNPQAYYVVGAEIGVDSTIIIVADLGLTIVFQKKIPTSGMNPEERLNSFFEGVKSTISASRVPREKLLGLGIGMHGLIDRDTGTVIFAPHLRGFENMKLASLCLEKLGLPTIVENDTRVRAIAETKLGVGGGSRNLIYVAITAGIGAAIVLDGELYRGTKNIAGELGHMPLDMNGRLCKCGGVGCLETLASSTAIVENVRSRLSGNLTIGDIIDAAKRGDDVACSALAEAATYLGMALAGIVNLLNPDMIVIAGEVAPAEDLFLRPLEEALRKRVLKGPGLDVRVRLGEMGDTGGALGASILLMENAQTRLAFKVVDFVTMERSVPLSTSL